MTKKFWNTVKPVFGNKVTTRNNITQIENKKVVLSEIELAKIFNRFLILFRSQELVFSSRNHNLETGNLSAIIEKYKNQFSIIAIEKYMKGLGKKSFNFSKAANDIVLRKITKVKY